MADSAGKKSAVIATLGLIAAGAGVAAYYLFILKPKKVTPLLNQSQIKVMLYKLNQFFQDKSESVNESGKDKVDSPPALVENLEEKKAAAANFIGQKLNASSEFQKFKHQGLDVSKDVEIEQVVNSTAEAGLTEALKEASPAQSQQSNLDEDTTEDITMLDYSKQSSFVTDFDSMTPDVVQVFDPEEDHHDLIGRSTALEKPHVCGKFCNPSLTKYVDTISLMIFLYCLFSNFFHD